LATGADEEEIIVIPARGDEKPKTITPMPPPRGNLKTNTRSN